MHWFLSFEDAYEKISTWVMEYNNFRPHSSLNDQTPAEVVEQCSISEAINSSTGALPGASLLEGMYFAAAEHSPTASENTYLQEEILTPHRSPNSPT
jgi:putative transposase